MDYLNLRNKLIIGVTMGGAFLPSVVSAQEWISYVGGTLSILDVYIFWSTIVLAIVAIGMVFSNAIKMKGGVFATVLNFFGSGMTVTFLGYITMTCPFLRDISFAGLLSDILFIIGYVLMAIAASRLASAIGK